MAKNELFPFFKPAGDFSGKAVLLLPVLAALTQYLGSV